MGVLWHQGEGDCGEDKYPNYCTQFKAIMDELRNCLGIPNLPVLIGGLGDFLAQCTLSEQLKNYKHINRALQQFAVRYPDCAYVSAEGLGANPDNLHFSAKALEEFGVRYFEEYQKFDRYSEHCFKEPKEDDAHRTKMELL